MAEALEKKYGVLVPFSFPFFAKNVFSSKTVLTIGLGEPNI